MSSHSADLRVTHDPRVRLRPRGSSQVGLGQFNERVVLQAIRLHGPLPKADIARLTHLTAQTVSLIIARLEAERLVVRYEPVRGKVGQPSVPIALNPDGAYAIGIKIGRRSMDVLLVDFSGAARERLTLEYRFPDADTLFDEIGERLRQLRRKLGPERSRRLQGIGIAAPLSLGGWQSLLGVSRTQATKWEGVDIRARVAAITDLPVQLIKDTAAACVAELVSGRGREIASFLYIFVDTFIGGGLVIDSHLHFGQHGNGGAIGSLPLSDASLRGRGSMPAQLLSTASLYQLEMLYQQAGLDVGAIADARALQAPWRKHSIRWLQRAVPAIALAVHDAACLLDIDGIIIDGSFSREMLDELLTQARGALDRYNWEGVARPTLYAGAIGSDARAMGGALLPLYANFAPDRELFMKIDR